jgi:hypothetical protein
VEIYQKISTKLCRIYNISNFTSPIMQNHVL